MRSRNPPATPDTVAGTARADDPDGLDSIWVSVDSVVAGEDGGFDRSLTTRFEFPVRAGRSPLERIPVAIRARDIGGFEVTRDTFVVVVP